MVAALRKKDSSMPFDLEMITRDPLKIPVFTEKYWATFDDAYSPPCRARPRPRCGDRAQASAQSRSREPPHEPGGAAKAEDDNILGNPSPTRASS
jgi:hypothetical protein